MEWYPECFTVVMREKFYGLVKEYSAIARECDLCQEECLAAPEGIEREQANRRLDLTRKRYSALRREIHRYPEINTLHHASASNNPPLRYRTQAG
jgi:hypothetical protein